MKLRSFLLLISCFTYCVTKAQIQNNIQINIAASAAINGTRFNIDIYEHNENIKIVYSVFDSLKRSDMNRDDFFNRYMAGKGLHDSITAKKFLTEIKKYEVFTRDSVQLLSDINSDYADLLKQIATSTSQQLTKGNKFGLDGISISIFISTPNSTNKVSTWSPDQSSNPEIYQLITRSLDIYRKKNNNGFLDKKRTFNY